MGDDYQPGDEFDWDQSNPDQYCDHGTFIGSWWGPDILCQWCEDGISAEDFQRVMAERRHDSLVHRATYALYDDVSDIVRSRRDSISGNPDGFADWVASVLRDIKQADDATLLSFVGAD